MSAGHCGSTTCLSVLDQIIVEKQQPHTYTHQTCKSIHPSIHPSIGNPSIHPSIHHQPASQSNILTVLKDKRLAGLVGGSIRKNVLCVMYCTRLLGREQPWSVCRSNQSVRPGEGFYIERSSTPHWRVYTEECFSSFYVQGS